MSNNCYASNPLMEDPKLKQCFMSLPAYIQESITQSGIEIKSEEHLRQIAQNFEKKQ